MLPVSLDFWSDQATVFEIRGKHTMEPYEIGSGSWNKGGQAREKIQGVKDNPAWSPSHKGFLTDKSPSPVSS